MLGCLIALGCGADPPPPATAAPPPAPPTASEATVQVSPPEDAASAEAPPAAPPPPKPTHCPQGMLLVEGDYCSEVKQRCIRHTTVFGSKKKICQEFEAPTECIGKKEGKRFCIDRYSFPNQKGVRPEVMNTFYQAQVKCAAQGKRMCTESEWTFACEGPEMKPFPYGYTRDATKCNGDQTWDNPSMKKVARRDPTELARLWKGVPSGTQPECVSDFGVHDLPGNNDEVVSNDHPVGSWNAKFNSVHTGGPWYDTARNQCRPKIYTHDEHFYYYFLGFRCCAEPDGAETDPRTPMQRARKYKWQVIEKLAGWTVEEVREVLKKKEAGTCTCEEKDIRCKTLCGTLLGPEAKDIDLKAPRNPATK